MLYTYWHKTSPPPTPPHENVAPATAIQKGIKEKLPRSRKIYQDIIDPNSPNLLGPTSLRDRASERVILKNQSVQHHLGL